MNYEIVEYNSIYCNEIISLIVRNLMDVNKKIMVLKKCVNMPQNLLHKH